MAGRHGIARIGQTPADLPTRRPANIPKIPTHSRRCVYAGRRFPPLGSRLSSSGRPVFDVRSVFFRCLSEHSLTDVFTVQLRGGRTQSSPRV
jgi:hypothetical protein